ncbi:uncharacterized protein PFL1_00164 [Pseudozyma flocculosa PF-1]|uniref:Related to D-arabinitol 2-dehydrogenase n=1 Tax=Pseudozyma flocculosa TaxID=84751 RepID=A0A5C3EU95_9BASI|nr:uncharacterized protein PFL1_00164 [Pseudozyma flocculosa PF-1]EPQ31965.1 hypothetical protein PFL1_00164 [Pseudozyma flocculosa PF-1]SPO35116.1 related to D-arabinitol 2-dehydrogenase [Pseudozyma flocculosa]
MLATRTALPSLARQVASRSHLAPALARNLSTTPNLLTKHNGSDRKPDAKDKAATAATAAKLDKPPFARTVDEVTIPYPDDSTRHPSKDVGHSTTGGKVGRHTQRTLASFSMEGKVCVVTGAARGLGNLIARTFVESGANHVAVLDLKPDECKQAADDIDAWFTQHGQTQPGELSVEGYGCDISNEQAVQDTFQRIRQKYGRIDVVVNSAGIVENFPATEYPTEKMRKLYDINVHGSYFVAREAAKHMLADGIRGSIVLVASMSAAVTNIPQPQAPYNASKAAVRHMAGSFAVEWAKAGIRVNSLSPGYMLTSLTRTILDSSPTGKELKQTWENLTPMGRMGNPEDLKGAIIYLASDASAFTTGTDLLVDGGYTAV